jgi:hypothetical protein
VGALALSDAVVTSIAGVVGVLITAAGALAGVIVNVRAQKAPTETEVDDAARISELEADLEAMTIDRDWWRNLAQMYIPKPPQETTE